MLPGVFTCAYHDSAGDTEAYRGFGASHPAEDVPSCFDLLMRGIASRTAPTAASPGSSPLAAARAFGLVALSPGARALTLTPPAANACA